MTTGCMQAHNIQIKGRNVDQPRRDGRLDATTGEVVRGGTLCVSLGHDWRSD
jgi:hypothetical protein